MHGAAVEDDRILRSDRRFFGQTLHRKTLSALAPRRPDISGNANQFISRSVTHVCKWVSSLPATLSL